MNEPNGIQPLLQEVGTAYQSLAAENIRSKAKIADLETELRSMKDDRDQVTQMLERHPRQARSILSGYANSP